MTTTLSDLSTPKLAGDRHELHVPEGWAQGRGAYGGLVVASLIRAIEERTGGQYAPSPGVVYPTLTMLTDMGLVEEQASEGSRKAFAATDEGRTHLEESAAEADALFARLDEAKPREAPHGGANIRRAMGNLMSALRNRVAHEGFDEALVHEVTAILDDAAQRIERLK